MRRRIRTISGYLAGTLMRTVKISPAGHSREQGVGHAELSPRLAGILSQVSRVLDLRYASGMEHVEAALAALGLRLIIDVVRAALIN
jgi:hypothetical protein